MKEDISRRKVLKMLGLAGTGLAAGSILPSYLRHFSGLNGQETNTPTGNAVETSNLEGGSAPADEFTLTLSPSENQDIHYVINSNGRIEKSAANGASKNPDDHIFGTKAAGVLKSGTDSYIMYGGIKEFHSNGDIQVAINGEKISNEEFKNVVIGQCEIPEKAQE